MPYPRKARRHDFIIFTSLAKASSGHDCLYNTARCAVLRKQRRRLYTYAFRWNALHDSLNKKRG